MMRGIPTTLFALFIAAALPACGGSPGGDIRSSTFERLEKVRKEKKEVVISRLERLLEKTSDARNDQVLLRLFFTFHGKDPHDRFSRAALRGEMAELDEHYVFKYGEFYDILFIDNDGMVFHSVKMESDYGDNIFAGPLSRTNLSRTLRRDPDARFIDYDYYAPSDEAASFFVARVTKDGEAQGWIIFQFSINTINSLLADYELLGRTGEVYLTNEEKIMVTQSRLVSGDTVLKLRIDTEAIREALANNSGNKVILDYRNVRVFSSFEKFSFLGSTWIIAAEIDEDEVITEHFRENMEYYLPKIFERLGPGVEIPRRDEMLEKANVRVDINEYARGSSGDVLVTHGLFTCTGVMISQPTRFTYLGHLYPLDEAFTSPLERILIGIGLRFIGGASGEEARDLLGEMLRRMKHYDVYPFEIRDLRAVVVAVHTKGFGNVVGKLLNEGFFLSQIKLLYDPGMRYANISSDVGGAFTAVEWLGPDGRSANWTGVNGIEDLGELVKSISGYAS